MLEQLEARRLFSAGVAAKLVIITPTASLPAGGGFIRIVVDIDDSDGNLVTSATNNVTLSAIKQPDGANFSAIKVKAVNGVAKFKNLPAFDVAGVYKVQATHGSLAAGNAPKFTVNPGPATQLNFVDQPTNVPVGSIIPTVSVKIQDQFGNIATADNGAVRLHADVVPTGASFPSILFHAVNGYASFNSVILSTPGKYQFESTRPGLTPGYSLYCITQINFTVNATENVQAISPFIYGVNQNLPGYNNPTLLRLGGNRWTAYNWVTNASNAGSDYLYENDDYLSSSSTPGAAVAPTLAEASSLDAGTLLTIPMNGLVSADESGPVDTTDPNRFTTRFKPEYPVDPNPFSLSPDPNAPAVYEDEFVNWVKANYPYGTTDPSRPISFELDNEPDLWNSTHLEVHPNQTTYAELLADSIAYATAIKNVEPGALIYGPVNYGFEGMYNLQDAPDSAQNGNFIDYYLKQMSQASTAAGKRLLNVLDFHWYSEDTADGIRVSGDDDSPDVAAERMQAPRSLFDPTFTENSFITQDVLGGPIVLLPTLKEQIANDFPGTKISISEYNYGGGNYIDGGVAEADALGIYGAQGLYSANEYSLINNEDYIGAAFNMYRNYDGNGATFGDTSIAATTDDESDTSIYASLDSSDPNHEVLVALNKSTVPLTVHISLQNSKAFTQAAIYQLTGAAANPVFAGRMALTDPAMLTYTLPPESVSTINLTAPGIVPVVGQTPVVPVPAVDQTPPDLTRLDLASGSDLLS
jgi:hypothetical protein